AGNHRIAGAGVDNKFRSGFVIQPSFDNDHLPLLLKRDGGFGQGSRRRLLTPRRLDALYTAHFGALLIGDILKVIGEVNDPVLIDPAIEFYGRGRPDREYK